jgi:hypothetical protein
MIERMPRAVIDIDGVLCEPIDYRASPHYIDRVPTYFAHALIDLFRMRGYRITLFTARYEEDREVTIEWLKEYGIGYDELIMGKPRADIYVDDLGFRFTGKHDCMEELKRII